MVLVDTATKETFQAILEWVNEGETLLQTKRI